MGTHSLSHHSQASTALSHSFQTSLSCSIDGLDLHSFITPSTTHSLYKETSPHSLVSPTKNIFKQHRYRPSQSTTCFPNSPSPSRHSRLALPLLATLSSPTAAATTSGSGRSLPDTVCPQRSASLHVPPTASPTLVPALPWRSATTAAARSTAKLEHTALRRSTTSTSLCRSLRSQSPSSCAPRPWAPAPTCT